MAGLAETAVIDAAQIHAPANWSIIGSDNIWTGLILGLRPADERRRYKITSFLIGWAQT